MSKWLWCCAAAASVAVGGLYVAGRHDGSPPAPAACDRLACLEECEHVCASIRPSSEPVAPAPAEVIPPPAVAAEELTPARLPGQIVIAESEESWAARPALMPRVFGASLLPGTVEESEAVLARMPLVRDDDPAPMPPAEAVRELLPPPGVADADDKVHDDHPGHPSCPRFGGRLPVLPKTIKGRDNLSGTEECEPLLPKQREGLSPRRTTNVDTAEFRPSDAGLNRSDLRGPF